MINTQWQKDVLAMRRETRAMDKAGWEYLGEGGGRIWELTRGWRWDHHIVAAKVALDGKGVWVKVEPLAN